MTEIANPSHLERWRAQSLKIAQELKDIPEWKGKDKLKVGIAFDDAIVTIELAVASITAASLEDLAESIFISAVEEVQRKQGQAPEAATPGKTGEQAADQAPETTTPSPAAVQPITQLGKCWRRIEPEYVKGCENDATGGVRLILFPAETLQKRYGRKSMLSLILDIPVCSSCFPKMTAHQVIADGLAPGQWGQMSKIAQQLNKGWLPIKENSLIEHVPPEDPQYMALRAQIAKSAGAAP